MAQKKWTWQRGQRSLVKVLAAFALVAGFTHAIQGEAGLFGWWEDPVEQPSGGDEAVANGDSTSDSNTKKKKDCGCGY